MVAILVGLFLLQGAPVRPSPEEARLVAHARDHAPEAVALLEKLVNVNSGTLNHEGVREVGRILRAELDALGFATRWAEAPETKRAGHLFAEHKGTKGNQLFLLGHLDTLFHQNTP